MPLRTDQTKGGRTRPKKTRAASARAAISLTVASVLAAVNRGATSPEVSRRHRLDSEVGGSRSRQTRVGVPSGPERRWPMVLLKRARCVPASRVDGAERRVGASICGRRAASVRCRSDRYRRIHRRRRLKRIEQEMGCDVHVRSLLFAVGDGDHEDGVRDRLIVRVLDKDRRGPKLRVPACSSSHPPQRQRAGLHLVEEDAVFHPICRT